MDFENFQFPDDLKKSVAVNDFISDMWIRPENTQVKFEFGSSRIIFGRVMPLGLRQFSVSR